MSTVANINTVKINVVPDLEDNDDFIDKDNLLNDITSENGLNAPPVVEARKKGLFRGMEAL